MLPLFFLLEGLLEARMGTFGCSQRALQVTAAGPCLVCRESLCRCVFLATRGVRAGVSHTVCVGLCVFFLPAPVSPRRNQMTEKVGLGARTRGRQSLPFSWCPVLGEGREAGSAE